MKSLFKLIAVLLVVVLTMGLLAGCGADPVDPTPTDPDDPSGPTDPTDPTDPSDGDKEKAATEKFKANIDELLPILDSLARTMSGGSSAYKPQDSFFIWVALYNMTSNHARENVTVIYDKASEKLTVPAALIKEYAAACFYGMTEVPAAPEGFGAMQYDAAGDTYKTVNSDIGLATTVNSYTYNSDGSFTVLITFAPNGGEQYNYTVTMVENPGSSVYQYAVRNMFQS